MRHPLSVLCMAAVAGCAPCSYMECPSEAPSAAVDAAIADAGDVIDVRALLQDPWWELFGDEQLAAFIALAYEKNPSLREAYANIMLAEANADRVRAALLPNILWAADVSRQKLSETGIVPFNEAPPGVAGPAPAQLVATGGTNLIPVYFTQSETEFNLSYDFDLWGKNRNTWCAALSEVQANIADEAFARLQLGIAVAQTYFRLQIDYRRLEVARRLVDLNNAMLALRQQRTDVGIDSLLTVQQAKTSLSSARVNALQLEADIAVNENKLRCYLAGQFDEEILPREIAEAPLPKVPLPGDLPLHLVAHRPDIVAQLWLIESAGKQIDVARAGFYPDVSINALFGYQTIHLHKWFEWPSVFFNADPAVSLPIFDGGRLAANLAGREVNYALAIEEYRQMVLKAVNEVLDGLALLRNTGTQLEVFGTKLRDQEELFGLSVLRAENNLDSELDTIVSEALLLGVRDQQLATLGSAYQAALMLIKAVGGGYEACYIEG